MKTQWLMIKKAVFLTTACTLTLVFPLVFTAGAHHTETGQRGEVFSDPSKQFPMPGDWIDKSITYDREAERADADLAIVMDQDIYYTLLPIIQKFGKENNLKIFVKEGTCGIAAGMLGKKSIDMGGFCCPSWRRRPPARTAFPYHGDRSHNIFRSSRQPCGLHRFFATAGYLSREDLSLVGTQNTAGRARTKP